MSTNGVPTPAQSLRKQPPRQARQQGSSKPIGSLASSLKPKNSAQRLVYFKKKNQERYEAMTEEERKLFNRRRNKMRSTNAQSRKKRRAQTKTQQLPGASPPTTSSSSTSSEQGDVASSSEDSDIEMENYYDVGKHLLAEAALKAPKQEMLPNLESPGVEDHCLIDVSSLLTSDPAVPPAPLCFKQIGAAKKNKTKSISLPWGKDNFGQTEEALHRAIENGLESFEDVKALMRKISINEDLSALEKFHDALRDERKKGFFKLILEIAKLALRGKELFPGRVPACEITQGSNQCSVTLSQEQCACLLALGFFGIVSNDDRKEFSLFTMTPFFSKKTVMAIEKLQFVMVYFCKVICNPPTGVVSFRRCSITQEERKRLLERPLPLSQVGLQKTPIETCHYALQVISSYSMIGGALPSDVGIPGQEDVALLCCPEMIIASLLCPELNDNEAIFIVGAQQYSSYSGSGGNLLFKKLDRTNEERDKYRRIRNQVVAMDAGWFETREEQFSEEKILREITKALIGFSSHGSNASPVATGNWGCGNSRKGDLQLKCVIQLIAASVAGRPIVYCPFDQVKSAIEFCQLRDYLHKKKISTDILLGKLYEYKNNAASISLFDYLKKVL